jgi:excisionase family DNA binding protein
MRYHVDMDGYISATEAAKLIGCVDSRVRQLLRAKKLVGERVGRDWLVLKTSAEAYRDAGHKPGRPPKGEGK